MAAGLRPLLLLAVRVFTASVPAALPGPAPAPLRSAASRLQEIQYFVDVIPRHTESLLAGAQGRTVETGRINWPAGEFGWVGAADCGSQIDEFEQARRQDLPIELLTGSVLSGMWIPEK